MPRLLKTVQDLQGYRNEIKVLGHNITVGFVPTMGSLHEGHFELIRNSKKNNDLTFVSIFVNPTQFNNRQDFETYPNHLESDIEFLRQLNVDALILPQVNDIYPNGYKFKLTENQDSIDLCGKARPGHFDGVLTVLIKLFNLVRPNNVYMGLKDYQQYKLVKNMVEDLFLDINIVGVETVREKSGLALSSRNLNLSSSQKIVAENYASIFAKDINLADMRLQLEALDLKIDYLVEKWGRKFIAVFIGDVRLIDNRELASKSIDTKSEDQGQLSVNKNIVKSKNILFKMSGSIACYKACDVISKLVQQGHNVQIVVTEDVFNFVGRATLEGLTGNPVLSEMYQAGHMMSHIHLNDWCDITVLCPASANTLVKISIGLSDNLLSALSLSSDKNKPYLIFPAMNTSMLQAKPVQNALTNLRAMNRNVVLGESGPLACGHLGQGRLAEPKFILNEIQKFLDSKTKIFKQTKKKILITAGGTSEPIDPVRFVTNTSSGDTGLKICEYLAEDYDIVLLAAEAMKPKVELLVDSGVTVQTTYFRSFKDLETKLHYLLENNNFEAIVHLAAVSDYSPVAIHMNQKSSDLPTSEKLSISEDFLIEFKKNKKLISEIRKLSLNKNIKVIGFKLLRTDDEQKIKFEIDKILQDSDCVVVNSLENITDKKHVYEIYNLSGLVFHGNSKLDMAEDISKILNNEVNL